jgi:L-asparaginase
LKKNILILYTGGTFGMQQTERGLAPSGNLTERIAPILQPYEDQDISWQVQSLSPLLDSANMQGKYWVQMADLIVAAPDADAVLLIHGTDSMAYTASALTYLLHQRFALPLIITGSQFPLGTENGDAEGNLKNAIEHCIETETGVFVSFAGELIPGARSSKKCQCLGRFRRAETRNHASANHRYWFRLYSRQAIIYRLEYWRHSHHPRAQC